MFDISLFMRLLPYVWLVTCLFTSTACEQLRRLDHHDPSLQLERSEYEARLTGQGEHRIIPIPTPKPLPPSSNPNTTPENLPHFQRPVSLTITETIPIKDVLLEMARQAKVNLVIDPTIEKGVYLHAHKQPFINVIKDICAMTGLRYRIQGGGLIIESDTPYLENYNVAFLSLSRQHQNRISMATDVFTAMEGYSRDFDNGSSAMIKGESNVDFWQEIEVTLKSLLSCLSSQNNTAGVTSYTIHKQAGLISVFATQSQQQKIAAYLDQIMANIQQQVLIEAKIIEVNLNEEYQGGINWHHVKNDFKLISPLGRISIPGPFDESMLRDREIFTIGSGSETLTALARILNRFGTVRTLSSPRMTVMNNQSAVLKVATNLVFFKINYSRELRENEKNDIERASSQIQTVPIGLVMVVQPTINPQSRRVTLNIRPTISRVINEKEDPAVGILSNETKTSKIPEVQVRELDSILQMSSGDVVVMGGLMEERADNERTGPPFLQDIPVLGHLFSGKTNKRTVNELVIFLRATILDNTTESITTADTRVYETFAQDPRPLSLPGN